MIESMTDPVVSNKPTVKKQPTRHTSKAKAPRLVYYPESDGEPMADSDYQYDAMVDGKFSLINRHEDDPYVYVAANMFIYYVKGDSTKSVAPDIFVVHGVTKRKRSSYKIWQEGRIPSVVFEIASTGTFAKDLVKKSLYLKLRIPEYIMLDPFGGEYFGEPLHGFRMTRNEQNEFIYEPIAKLASDDKTMIAGIYSEELGLEIWAKHGPVDDAPAIFRFRNPQTGEWLMSQRENEADRRAARERAEQEAQRAEQESQRADQESQRAEQESQRAEQERRARLTAEVEIDRLRELLDQMNAKRDNQ